IHSIVAVTGLSGHAFGSWRSRETRRMWLHDFLPWDVPNVRVLTYGYNVDLTRTNNFATEYLREFICELERTRNSPEVSIRPGIL
ncbi:hypothetical protein FN846DRAFT_777136, partial [Sphaerosporella brunnea]